MNKIKKDIFNNKKYLYIKVKPKSSKQELLITDENEIIAYLKSEPKENKANEELIKLFKKEYKLEIKIKSGHTNKKKLIELEE